MIEQSISAPIDCKFVPDLDEEQAKQQARLFKALADPTRLRLLSLLSEHGGKICVSELVECFTLAQPTLSHHLRILQSAGLIDNHKYGLHCYYYVKSAKLNEAWNDLRALDALEPVES